MRRVTPALAFAIGVAATIALTGCGRAAALEDIPVGSHVTIETNAGRVVRGTLAEVSVDRVVVKSEPTGQRRELSRDVVADVREGGVGLASLFSSAPASAEVTIPADTTVPIELETTLTSAGNHLEDPVRARTRVPLTIADEVVLPAGSELRGQVTAAEPSGKVKGRARLRFQLTEIEARGEVYEIAAAPFAYEAASTKGKDAEKIGIGAAAGAIIGGLAGGKKGAVVGSAIGGGAGTAVVMTTAGKEVELPSGTALQLRLRKPLTVRVPVEET